MTKKADIVGNVKDTLEAAESLKQHLGKTRTEWLDYLGEDRRRYGRHRQLPFERAEGEYWYDELALFVFIYMRNPAALERMRREAADEVASRLGSTLEPA